MLDMKFLRENPDIVKENIKKKFQDAKLPLVDEVIALDAEARIETDATTGEMMVICEIDNPTQMDAFDPTVTFGLYTAGGDLIYADGATQQSVGIPAGGKMMVRFFVDKAFVEQWRSYQALPASARVSASFRVDED